MKVMDWHKLLSSKRIGMANCITPTSRTRSEFDSDIDRITFSPAFRRLAKKTQVHPLAPNDHVHTRLAHSLEVARVGFALGRALGSFLEEEKHLPNDRTPIDVGTIVQAACLAHDIGNPAFGHAGESAIKYWFKTSEIHILDDEHLSNKQKNDLSSYEGNAQGFRILTQIENHVFNGGLQLTAATLGASLKYPYTSENARIHDGKFGVYLSEEKVLSQVAGYTGLISHKEVKNSWCRHPLAFLVEAADDICYAIIDLEDAVELKILPFDKVSNILTSCLNENECENLVKNFHNPLFPDQAHRVNLSRIRSAIFDKLVNTAIEAFKSKYTDIMTGQFTDELFAILPAEDRCQQLVKSAKCVAKKKIFTDQKKLENEIGSYAIYGCLLEAFCMAALDCAKSIRKNCKDKIDEKSKLVLRYLGDHSPTFDNAARPDGQDWDDYQCLRRVLDFVGGMTDNYAVYVAQQLQGSGYSGRQRP